MGIGYYDRVLHWSYNVGLRSNTRRVSVAMKVKRRCLQALNGEIQMERAPSLL